MPAYGVVLSGDVNGRRLHLDQLSELSPQFCCPGTRRTRSVCKKTFPNLHTKDCIILTVLYEGLLMLDTMIDTKLTLQFY